MWFTLRGGSVSEVFYPDLSTPSVRSLDLTVSDGTTTDVQSSDMRTVVARPDERSLRFTQVSTDLEGRYRITEEVVTDPDRSAVVIHARLESLDGGTYRWASTTTRRSATAATTTAAGAPTTGYSAVDPDDTSPAPLVASPALTDGRDGIDVDLVQTATLPTTTTGETTSASASAPPREAGRTATAAVRRPWTTTQAAYDAGWHDYLSSLKSPRQCAGHGAPVPRQRPGPRGRRGQGPPGRVHRQPLGAVGVGRRDQGPQRPVRVLPRGLVARPLPDRHRPVRRRRQGRRPARVRWLFRTQQKADGSFPQNSDVDGTEEWTELQLDQVTLPIALAHLVGQTDDRTYRGIKKAVGFLMTFRDEETGFRAPYSPQERWENQSGYSPATIAAQIDGLVTGAAIARSKGDRALARRWERTADRWASHVKDWTATSNGPLSDKPYFLRVTKDGKPNAGTTYGIGDGGPANADQRRVVDPSFLDLVRFGILSPTDRSSATRSPSSTRTWPWTPRTGPTGTASPSTATGRPAPATSGGSPTTARARRSAGPGRCWPASAASTPWPRAWTVRRTSPPWPPPRAGAT